MKKIKKILLILLLFPLLTIARGPEKEDKTTNREPLPGLAAGCTPATSLVFLEFNNVRTRVEAGGLWWQDRPNTRADYEVPKGSNSFAIFAGGLWMGGTDVNGQLKAAASLFGNAVDYWSGPLDTTDEAEITPETCEAWDRFFRLTRAEVAQFVAFQNAVLEGTEDELFPGYQIPNSILEWPGNGNASLGQAFRLAPYINVAGDASYEPELGDFPFYDLTGTVDCRAERTDRSESSRRPLFGDETFWWIFNDKGNLHTETQAPSIGMEIHAQAFSFATNDAVNDMTFFNFELINRSTFTLTETYFGSYVDSDVGNSADDYVGCDVNRGLGYAYNGDEFDEDVRGQNGYGSNPAAIGVDFFEGPFQDADGIDNPVGIGPNQALNGLGYGDGIPNNERFGMRRFVFYNIGNAANGDPQLAIHYYNYLRGIWKNGQFMLHGGNGFNSAAVENPPIRTSFMFPGDTDPLNWGTTDRNGVTTVPVNQNWTEDNPGVGETRNPPGDRRFLQSAGPFTLRPGNVNDITVGIVFAQAENGGRLASVQKLFTADDKAQALFDNCFQVLNGPDAPQVDVQELNRELIFYLSNSEISNNKEEFGKPYAEKDVNIVTPQFLVNQTPPIFYDDSFRFQGYQVYQLSGPNVSVADIEDPDKARLVFQTDVKDSVQDLTNFTFDEQLQASVPIKKVQAANEGIVRSFSVTQDLFASGDDELVNFKTYYYLAIAYGYNEFKRYAQDVAPDLNNPFAPASDGQKAPYLSSRRGADGGNVRVIRAIPHDPLFENGGTVQRSNFGDQIQITRLQGAGNGGKALDIGDESLNKILDEKTWLDDNINVTEIDYVPGNGPFVVKVVDPLNVVDGVFFLQILDNATSGGNPIVTDTAKWKIWLDGGGADDTVFSNRSIAFENEQLLFSPNWGLSITIKNGVMPGNPNNENNGFISSTIRFSSDNVANQWLTGIPDTDRDDPTNWILSGTNTNAGISVYQDIQTGPPTNAFVDPNEAYEDIINGTFAPYRLVRQGFIVGDPRTDNKVANNPTDVSRSPLSLLNSVVVVFTSDKSKWSRCPVLETSDANSFANWGIVKSNKLSIDKDGKPVDTTGFGNLTMAQIADQLASTNEEDAGFISATGMGWFPGYAINKETGERLNIVYGEDSRFSIHNGDDMQWNPNSVVGEGRVTFNRVWGGKHFTYIFRETTPFDVPFLPPPFLNLPRIPQYDDGKVLRQYLSNPAGNIRQIAWQHCSWVTIPMLVPGTELLASDVKVNINVNRPFAVKNSDIDPSLDNNGKPVYRFNTRGKDVTLSETRELADRLKDINIVPNPYRGISEYEVDQIDNIVKITNLPEQALIRIYNMNGTLIRTFNKANPQNFLDWDLKNQVGIPIASGVYLIHVNVPGVGEKILKWFGVLRPVDLNNF